MSTEETRAILNRAIALGMENYEAIADELHSEDVVNHGPVEDDHGPEGWKRRQAQFISAFSENVFKKRLVLPTRKSGQSLNLGP